MGEPVHGPWACVPDLTPHWPFRVGAGLHSPRQAEWFPITTLWSNVGELQHDLHLLSINMSLQYVFLLNL